MFSAPSVPKLCRVRDYKTNRSAERARGGPHNLAESLIRRSAVKWKTH